MVYELVANGEWNGEMFSQFVDDGFLQEFDGIWTHEAGECPYHLESLSNHVSSVIDYAAVFIKMFGWSKSQAEVLIAAATWHDVGKLTTRVWKQRMICQECGRSHSIGTLKCETPGCYDAHLVEKTVAGYHGHAWASAEVWRSVAEKHGFPSTMIDRVWLLIERHSHVHETVRFGRYVDSSPLAIFLSWADECGKISPSYYDRAGAMAAFHQAYDRSL